MLRIAEQEHHGGQGNQGKVEQTSFPSSPTAEREPQEVEGGVHRPKYFFGRDLPLFEVDSVA